MDEFNLYSDFITDNSFATLPFIKVPSTPNDVYIEWQTENRLDVLAYTYYGNPALGKLILLANPEYISEAEINSGNIVRIPMPKELFLNRIKDAIMTSKNF